jgi:hypothetical protein
MPLDDEELDQLCHRRVIVAKVYDSLENNVPKDRPAIVISTREQIQKSGKIKVVAVSHNAGIDSTYIMPMPAYTGFDGHIIGSFAPWIEEADVKEVCGLLSVPDMGKAMSLVRQAAESKKSAKDGFA